MKTIPEIRLNNFELLIREAGNVSELARRCGYQKPTYLYQIRAQQRKENGKTMQIGRQLAAKLEQAMGKPSGWLDIDHAAVPKRSAVWTNRQPENMVDHSGIRTVTLALTGASGMPYGLRLLECLLAAGKTVYLLYSQAAQVVSQQEGDFALPSSPEAAKQLLDERFQTAEGQLLVFGKHEWYAPVASGTGVADAMVVCPASMGVVASIVQGTSEHLLERAADVCIKERRPLVIVPRETPLSALHLENLLKLAQFGCTILPPSAGFYTHPQSVDDMVDFVVARILDQLRIPQQLIPQWGLQ